MSEEGRVHEPVMVREVLSALLGEGRRRFVDGTVGTGGHAAEILEKDSEAVVLGLDRDEEVLEVAAKRLERFGDRIVLRHSSYAELGRVLGSVGWRKADGFLLDLGLSSWQLSRAERGFSFMREGALDCRFSRREGETAADLIARLSEEELAEIIRRYGEERRARTIARRLKQARPRTTVELAEIVGSLKRGRRGRIHPATKVFQALRIAVNRELDHLEKFLRRFPRFLAPGGRVAVISYHSLEDRLVKNAFALLAGEGMGAVLTRKPLTPRAEEVERNPRSRSAKLRVFEAAGP